MERAGNRRALRTARGVRTSGGSTPGRAAQGELSRLQHRKASASPHMPRYLPGSTTQDRGLRVGMCSPRAAPDTSRSRQDPWGSWSMGRYRIRPQATIRIEPRSRLDACVRIASLLLATRVATSWDAGTAVAGESATFRASCPIGAARWRVPSQRAATRRIKRTMRYQDRRSELSPHAAMRPTIGRPLSDDETPGLQHLANGGIVAARTGAP